ESLVARDYNTGAIGHGFFQSLSQIFADTLVSLRDNGSSWGTPPGDVNSNPYGDLYGDPYGGWNLDPIGAFYESAGAALDPAASIAHLTPLLLDGAAGDGTSWNSPDAAALRARDANHDGKLSGAELEGLMAWSDANED